MHNPLSARTTPFPGTSIYAGMFLICFSTIVYEIALTRIFSALMYYHFASMAVALAMLGMGLGGILVYLRAEKFETGGVDGPAFYSLLFGVSVFVLYLMGLLVTRFPEEVSVVLSYFHTPYYGQGRLGAGTGEGTQGYGLMALLGLAAATMIPFFLGGVTVSSLLSGFPARANSLYLADMLGAGLGALAIIPLLGRLGGPGTLLFASVLGPAAALAFRQAPPARWIVRAAVGFMLIIAVFMWAEWRHGLVRFDFVGGRYEPNVLLTRWNSFSRVLVYGGKTEEMRQRAWGISRTYAGPRPEEMNIVVNDTGFTTMVKGVSREELESLKYDVTNLPFMMRPGGKTLVIGPGGGRDVQSAIVFGSRDVTAVEVNPLLRDIVEDSFGDFSGRPYDKPGVKLVIDDGRSFLMRDSSTYDVIEAARVYEWVEAMSGAFTFSENYLYTREAFKGYLSHLNPGGMLSITRFLHEKQTIRILALAMAAFRDIGVESPRDRTAILKERGLATFLFKRDPFTARELQQLSDISADLGFEVVYLPGNDADNDFTRFLAAPDPAAFVANYPLDISPTTDDKPFFNFIMKRSDFWSGLGGIGGGRLENRALSMLKILLVTMCLLSAGLLMLPLLIFRSRIEGGNSTGGRLPLLIYFGALGLAFMLVEVNFLRKFILFLGQPVYSLSVVLFVLLAATGIGSYLSGRLGERQMAQIMWCAPPAVLLYTFLPGQVFDIFLASKVAVRMTVSAALLFPIGLLLGVMFPAGIRIAGTHGLRGYIPWFWAMNGVFSVLGTVVALVFAMSFGLAATTAAGGIVYLVAAAAFGLARREFATAEHARRKR